MCTYNERAGEIHQRRTQEANYSGTPLNGRPPTADTHDITDNSDYPTIYFNTLATPE